MQRQLVPKLDSNFRGRKKLPKTAGMVTLTSSDKTSKGKVSTAGQFPWQAAIVSDDTLGFCSGSLIGGLWVLTSGHCLGT